ncbi:hypothetical protein V3C99_002713 [Haemonchus contortus]
MDRAKYFQRNRYRNEDRTAGGVLLQQSLPRVQGGHMVNSRPFMNAAMVVRNLPPQVVHRIDENCKPSENACYSFSDFPIEMDDTSFNIMGRYSVALLHVYRFNMIFIRVKWMGVQSSPMCAMISFESTENEIRLAVEESAGYLERYDHLVRNGGRYPVSKCSLKYLESHHILALEKAHENFPDAIYWCSLCDFHMSNIQHVRTHFDTHQHFPEEQRINERKELLERMPKMSDNQLKAINALISELLHDKSENGRGSLWEQHMEVSKNISDLLSRHVFEKLGVTGQVAVYGSVIAKTCTESSDLNIDIDVPSVDCSDAVEAMKSVADLLKTAPGASDVQFSTEVPMSIKLTVSGVRVRISWRCENGLKYGKLLSVYTAIRPQFASLCRVVRKWAEVSGIYSVDRRQGGLTSYGFDLMVLYFLLQKNLLPCLHEMYSSTSQERKTEPSIEDFYENRELYENDVDLIIRKIGVLEKPWDLAELYVEFLCFYASRIHQNEIVQVYTVKQVSKDRSRWNKKLLQISDPFRTDNVVTFTKAYQVYFFNCFLKSFLYFAIPQTINGPLLDVTLYQKMGESPRKKKSKRRKTVDTAKSDKKEESKTPSTTANPKQCIESNASTSTHLATDIDEEEYTAAADELVEEEQKTEKIRQQIIEDMMPMPRPFSVVLDARRSNGHQDAMGMESGHQHQPSNIPANLFLNVACLSGLNLCCDSPNNVMTQLVAIAEATEATKNAITGCSLVDLDESLCGAYLLPDGDAFIVPKRSACGFFVASEWVNRVVDVIRLKRGLSEITIRLMSNHCLKVLQCLQLCGCYPIRRLQERIADLKAFPDTSVLVMFGFNGNNEMMAKDEIELEEQCEAIGLTLWKGLFGQGLEQSKNMIATFPSDEFAEIDEVSLEVLENLPMSSRVDLVNVALKGNCVRLSPEALEMKTKSETAKEVAISRLAKNMEQTVRKRERKVKRAERRRREKEQAKMVLQHLMASDEFVAENGKVLTTGGKPPRPDSQEDEVGENAIEPDITEAQVKKKRRTRRRKLHSVENDVEVVMEKLISHVSEVSLVTEGEVMERGFQRSKPRSVENDVKVVVEKLISDVSKVPSVAEEAVKDDDHRYKPHHLENDVEVVIEKLISDVLKASLVNEEEAMKNDSHQTTSESSATSESRNVTMNSKEPQEETSTVHDIRLKDLTPENVEIDDYMVYSRRTMKRIRDRNPIRIPENLYKILKAGCLAAREFKERDKELDHLLKLRREKILHEQKRERLRAQIKKAGEEGEGDKVQKDLEEYNPFDEVTCGYTEEDWIVSVDEESASNHAEIDANNDDSIDERVGNIENVEAVESNEVPETRDAEGKKLKPHICYENFFITVKDFDPQSLKEKIDDLTVDRFCYSFDDSQNFNNGYKPDIVCATCESSDHWSDVCPMMIVPKVEELHIEKALYEWMELDRVIIGGYDRTRVRTSRINEVGDFVDRLRIHLQNELKRPVRLNIFGSLLSGFGVANSDVDLCFRFQSDEQPLDIDGVEIVRQIAQHLQQMAEVDNVYAITGAKVPIVKFNWTRLGVEGDISYYNVLALSNTEMLKQYCSWDCRVAPLGVWIKRWAKSCDIGDASRGSLSSYAFIILLLHYLQNCEPPVLPRLQEDFRDGSIQPVVVDNCDVYFHREVIPDWSKNRQSVGELFVGFLDYYARFDFGTQVVQIRRKKPLLKMEKDWNRSLCIEDPFDLCHNLGSGVSRKMFVFIVRNIHNSRKLFMLSDVRRAFLEGRKVATDHEMPLRFSDEYAVVLLRKCQMGPAPTDRQCRICHRIGHFAEACQKSANGQRAPRRSELWTKRTAISHTTTPRSGYVFGTRINANQGDRVFYRRNERPPRGMRSFE